MITFTAWLDSLAGRLYEFADSLRTAECVHDTLSAYRKEVHELKLELEALKSDFSGHAEWHVAHPYIAPDLSLPPDKDPGLDA